MQTIYGEETHCIEAGGDFQDEWIHYADCVDAIVDIEMCENFTKFHLLKTCGGFFIPNKDLERLGESGGWGGRQNEEREEKGERKGGRKNLPGVLSIVPHLTSRPCPFMKWLLLPSLVLSHNILSHLISVPFTTYWTFQSTLSQTLFSLTTPATPVCLSELNVSYIFHDTCDRLSQSPCCAPTEQVAHLPKHSSLYLVTVDSLFGLSYGEILEE